MAVLLPGWAPWGREQQGGGRSPGKCSLFPTLVVRSCQLCRGGGNPGPADSWPRHILGERQHLAALWEPGTSGTAGWGYFKPECEKLVLRRTESFPEDGLRLICRPPLPSTAKASQVVWCRFGYGTWWLRGPLVVPPTPSCRQSRRFGARRCLGGWWESRGTSGEFILCPRFAPAAAPRLPARAVPGTLMDAGGRHPLLM